MAALRCMACGEVFHTLLPIIKNTCPICTKGGVHYKGIRYKSFKDVPLEITLNHQVYLPFNGLWFEAHQDLSAQLARLEGALPASVEPPAYELSELVRKYLDRSPDFMAWHDIYKELNNVSGQV